MADWVFACCIVLHIHPLLCFLYKPYSSIAALNLLRMTAYSGEVATFIMISGTSLKVHLLEPGIAMKPDFPRVSVPEANVPGHSQERLMQTFVCLFKMHTFQLLLDEHYKLLPAAELQIQKRKLKQRPTNRLQPQPQNVLMYVTKNIFRIQFFRTHVL